MDFYNLMKETQDNVSVTENGAVGYKTTGKELTDLFFKISSLRNENDADVRKEFKVLFESNEPYALKLLAYIRDIRGNGLGERRTFRLALEELLNHNFEGKDEFFVKMIVEFIPEFGRYDDMFVFMNTKYEKIVVDFIRAQLTQDLAYRKEGKPITLLAKWMPSINTSNKETVKLARKLANALNLSQRDYRKTLSDLRAYNNIVERQMCAKEWDEIDYNKVPSRANVKYNDAFLRNDEQRRRDYLAALRIGVDKDGNEVKINSSVNFPHDILHMYKGERVSYWEMKIKPYDEAIEQLWKNLKQMDGLKNTIVVRDDSGSMLSTIGNTNISAYEVATALGIYCAQHNSDAYRNKIISFSETPRYLDFSKYVSLYDIYNYLNEHSEVANTNIEGVFDLVLRTAVENNLKPEELPEQILILSDMEFDSCARDSHDRRGLTPTLFGHISDKYAQYGYKLPKLVFWNINSRTNTIPVKNNELGVILVSGFSQGVLTMINEGDLNPYDAIVKQLDKARYEDIPLFSIIVKPNSKAKLQDSKKYKSPLED